MPKKEEFSQKDIIRALSKITNIPIKEINQLTYLQHLAKKISVDVDGLLDRLCMKLVTQVSSRPNAIFVQDIIVGHCTWDELLGYKERGSGK